MLLLDDPFRVHSGLQREAGRALDCSGVRTDCIDYPPGYERRILRRGTAQGEVLDRTQGDRATNLSLQLRDYDVNAYLAGTKATHASALAQVTEFIQDRIARGASVGVTITGSASHTGDKAYNDALSCRRANCVAAALRRSLTAFALARTRIDVSGTGFTDATCRGGDCELPGFRSVLVSVHAPGRPPPPVPPEAPGWYRFEIRCCSFHTTFIVEALLDDLLRKLPSWVPAGVRTGLVKQIEAKFVALMKQLVRLSPKLGELVRDGSSLLRFIPIEITRQTAVLQVRERARPAPALSTLCYQGIGGRLSLPLGEKLDDAIDKWLNRIPRLPDLLRKRLRAQVKDALRRLLPPGVRSFLQKLDTDTPGPWKPFDLNRRARMTVFQGDGSIFLDAFTPGRLHLAFAAPPWRRPDKQLRTMMVNCTGCAESVIDVQVGDGVGFDLLSVSSGTLVAGGCRCGTARPLGARARRRPVRARAELWHGELGRSACSQGRCRCTRRAGAS